MQYYPRVTIIIPVYNGSNFLAQAIDAALAQTYGNCEVLVINDGSTDGGASEAIALSYGDRIRYFRKENGGVSTALNFAFTKMTGQWFSWLSHDDLYYPEKIEKQVAFLNRLLQEDPDIDLEKITVRTATESIDRDGKVIRVPSYRNVPEREEIPDTIINNVYTYRLSGCSFLLPASCVSRVGNFREDIRTVSDVEYWYRLLFAGYTFYCLSDDILVKNRSHGKQVGKTKVSLFDREVDQLHRDIADRLAASVHYSPEAMKRLYLGVASRNMTGAAAYIKKTYLTGTVSALDDRLLLPAKAGMYQLKGKLRTAVRYVYRRINVK